MVDERLTDGTRIAELLASEVTGHGDALEALTVAEADPDAKPSVDGTFAYAVESEGERVAEVYVHPDRVRVEFRVGHEAAAAAAEERRLRVRPTATDPPRTLVYVEDGAAVKRMVPVLEAALAA
jgi:hypothetical protein